MGKLDDLTVVKELVSASKALGPKISKFADAMSSHVINYRSEVKAEKAASKAAKAFERALTAAENEVEPLSASDAVLANGLRQLVTTEREDVSFSRTKPLRFCFFLVFGFADD